MNFGVAWGADIQQWQPGVRHIRRVRGLAMIRSATRSNNRRTDCTAV